MAFQYVNTTAYQRCFYWRIREVLGQGGVMPMKTLARLCGTAPTRHFRRLVANMVYEGDVWCGVRKIGGRNMLVYASREYNDEIVP